MVFLRTTIFSVLFLLLLLVNSCAQAAHEVRIPFVLDDNTQLIQVFVNNSQNPVYFIFDTGSQITGIDKEYAQQIGVQFDKKVRIEGVAGDSEALSSEQNTVKLNSQIVIENEKLTGIDLGFRKKTFSGYDVKGIMGAVILKRYSVEMDFDTHEIILRPLGANIPEKYQSSIATTHTGDFFPRIDLSIQINNGDTINGNAYFDSGAQMGFILNTRFDEQHHILEKSGDCLQRPSFGISQSGYNYVVRAKGMKIGNMNIPPFIMDIPTGAKGVGSEPNSLGLLGMEIIKRFNFVIDFSLNRIYYSPNGNSKKSTWAPVSGVVIKENNGKMYINAFAAPENPQGLLVGDEIISVNGKKHESARQAQDIFFRAEPNEKLNVIIQRDGSQIERTFIAEPML